MANTLTIPANPGNSPPELLRTSREKAVSWLYRVFRCLVVLNTFALFFPQLNPARISALINANLSLFTIGFSYESLRLDFGRAVTRGWISEGIIKELSMNSVIVVAGVILIIAGVCMSLGNNKLKKFGAVFSLAGGVVQLVGLLNIYQIHTIFTRLINADRINPMLPDTIYIYFGFSAMAILFSVICFLLVPKAEKEEDFRIEPPFQLFLMMLPIIAFAFVFSYLPLYGWRYAFFDYESGQTLSMDMFVGFKWFTMLFENAATRRDILNVMRNTFAMSGLGIITSWVPLAFAVFLSEIKNQQFKRIIQTLTTIPNFISWVLVYAVAIAIFSNDGFINTLINSLGGAADTNYLMNGNHMWTKMMLWGMWKGLGWSAIIYLAAISSIDQSLYEAATIDGAGRFAKMWYITVPSLFPTFCVLLLLGIAGILSNGLEQYLVFSNPFTRNSLRVLDLYVYDLGINAGVIPLSTVIGMAKTIFSVTLLLVANRISKILRGESIV